LVTIKAATRQTNGSLTVLELVIGHPGCRCHADPPRLHGPYHQWTRKKNGKTATRILTDEQLADYRPWFDNHRRLRELVACSRNSASTSPRPTPAGTARPPDAGRSRRARETERQTPDRVGGARLTCGQPTRQATFTQVNPKREDLTRSLLR
jgi:hypothetical protein